MYGSQREEFLSGAWSQRFKQDCFIYFQHGNEAASVADLKIADQLYHYMVGGQSKPQVSVNEKKLSYVV